MSDSSSWLQDLGRGASKNEFAQASKGRQPPHTEPETAPENRALYGYLTMIVALTTVFLGVKHYRDKTLGGVVRFWPALGVGLAISAVASSIQVIGWAISLAFGGFDFGAAASKMMLDSARARGHGSRADDGRRSG